MPDACPFLINPDWNGWIIHGKTVQSLIQQNG